MKFIIRKYMKYKEYMFDQKWSNFEPPYLRVLFKDGASTTIYTVYNACDPTLIHGP